ncbi:MAG: hypothetical protein HQK87_11855 [Nitrospinae bacterium]|nr:hypothetical protein [Nitrospinota bacterium]
MDRPATPFVVNNKITFCEAPEDDAPRYTGLVKKTKESLVALIVSNKDKGALFPDIGAIIYFPFEREGRAWMATASVAQNSSWPLLILELEGEAPVDLRESPLDLEEEESAPPVSPVWRADGSHLGDVEGTDEGLIHLPETEEDEPQAVAPLADNDELTDEELAAAEAGVVAALGDDDGPLAGMPVMPDPLRDLPEVDDADLAAELDADLNDALSRMTPLGPDGEGFDDDLSDMEMTVSQELDMGQGMDDPRFGTGLPDEGGDALPEEEPEEGTLLAWAKTAPLEAFPARPERDEVILDEIGDDAETPVQEEADETATLPPGLLPPPTDDREFFPVTVHGGEQPPLPAGLDPTVVGIIDHLQRRLARLEANLAPDVAATPYGPNGFCLALNGDRIVVALPAGCDLYEGDSVTVAVDHQWRDRLSFRLTATVASVRQDEGATVVNARFGVVDHEVAQAIDAYAEGIGAWRSLLSGLPLG